MSWPTRLSYNQPQESVKKRAILFATAILWALLILPSVTHAQSAQSIVAQPTITTAASNPAGIVNNPFTSFYSINVLIGNGYSGSTTGAVVYADAHNIPPNSQNIEFEIDAYSDASYTTNVAVCEYDSQNLSGTLSGPISVANLFQEFNSGCTLQPDLYYVVSFAFSADGPGAHWSDNFDSVSGATLPQSPNNWTWCTGGHAPTDCASYPPSDHFYAYFQLLGAGGGGASFPTGYTNIWYTSPPTAAVVPLGTTSLQTFGWITDWDSTTKIKVEWQNNACLYGADSVFNASIGAQTGPCEEGSIETPIPADPFDRTSFPFNTAATTTISNPGVFHVKWSIVKPYFSFFGLTLFEQTLYATSTSFIASTTTRYDDKLLAIASTTGVYGQATATTTPNDCLVFNISDCINLLFIPSANSLANIQFTQLQQTITRKPPLGYFTAAYTLIQTASTTATSSLPIAGMPVVALLLSPLRIGIQAVLWFLLLWWMFNRLRNFNWQS